MVTHYKYSLSELENMMPWEREIYVGLMLQYIEEEKIRIEQERTRGKWPHRKSYKKILSMHI